MASFLSALKKSFYDPFANAVSGQKQLTSNQQMSSLANPTPAAVAPKTLVPTQLNYANQGQVAQASIAPTTSVQPSITPNVPPKTLNVPSTTTGGANLTINEQGVITGVGGGGAASGDIAAPSGASGNEYTQKLQTLQTQLIEKVLSNLENYTDPSASIQQQYSDRQKAIEQAKETAKQVLQDQYGEAIGEAKETGARTLTSAQEARRGFATNSAVFTQLQDSTDKRVRQLTKDRDLALAMADSNAAGQLSDLIFKEQESLTNARTSYMDNVFKTLSGLQGAMSFETPQQQRQATTQQEIEIATAKQKLQKENPDIKAVRETGTAGERETRANQIEIDNIKNLLTNYGQRDYVSLGYYNQLKSSSSLSPTEFDKRFRYLLNEEDKVQVGKQNVSDLKSQIDIAWGG